ncbi:nucleotidyltransferase domain-containing protein [Candidatus Margulisiibacteriota bacterium]
MVLSSKNIQLIINKIKEKANPAQVFVFGSYALGKPTPDSDLDLLVLKNSIKNKRKELIELKKEIISKDYSVDILLYSQKEYKKKKKEGWKIFQEIEKKGIKY